MRFANRRLVLALAGAALIVTLRQGGPAASPRPVGWITSIAHGSVTIGTDSYVNGDAPVALLRKDVISMTGRTMVSFKLNVGSKGATCDLRRAPTTVAVVPDSSVLVHLELGQAACSTTAKGHKKTFKLGKDVTVTTQDPVFEASVAPRGATLKLQRGVAVVTGKRGKGVVVAFNRKRAPRLARSVFVPARGTPQQPKLTQLSTHEQATLTQLAASLPPVTDFRPPPTTLRARPADPTADRDAFFSFGGGDISACSLSPGPFVACTTAHTQVYRDLPPGRHTFSVRSIDAAGNTGPTVSYSWSVERSPSAPIVFESNRAEPTEFQIYTIRPDGGEATPLTKPPHQSFDPAWSPDGSEIVFESNRKTFGRSQLFVMDADGEDQHRLVTSPARDRFPKWSPDGTKIVFERGTDSRSDIYVVDADGTHPRQLTRDSGLNADPVWSPDGSQIAFDSSRSGNREIYVMNADGGDQHALTSSPASDINPAWSPDGKEIAFESDRDGKSRIYVMSSGGSEPQRLTAFDQLEFHPAWSPDGGRLVFAAGQGRDTQLQIVDRDGSGRRILTHSASQNLVPNW